MAEEKTTIQLNHPQMGALAEELLGLRQKRKPLESSEKIIRGELDKYLADINADIVVLGNGIQIKVVESTRKGTIDALELKKLGVEPGIIAKATKPSSTSTRLDIERLEQNG